MDDPTQLTREQLLGLIDDLQAHITIGEDDLRKLIAVSQAAAREMQRRAACGQRVQKDPAARIDPQVMTELLAVLKEVTALEY
jgi:hypothetical protein